MPEIAAEYRSPGTADFMRRRRGDIVAAWEQRVRAAPAARKLSRPALVDHIPYLLERIGELAEQRAGEDGLPRDDAERHAFIRLDEGFDLAEVIWEFRVLRRCLLEIWDRDVERPHAEGGARRLNDALDQVIAASVDRYLRSRDRTLHVLDRVSTAALESRSLDELLQRLLAVLVETTSSIDFASILLRDGQDLQVRASVGLGSEADVAARVPIGEGFAGRIARDRRAHLFTTASPDRSAKDEKIAGRGIRALYGLPLITGDDVIGVATIGSVTAFDFSEQDKRLVTTLASRASLAIQNALLVSRERCANAAARAFRVATSLDDAIPALLAELGKALGWDVGLYWRVDECADCLRLEHFWSAPDVALAAFERASREVALHRGEGLPGRAWESHVAAWTRDVTSDATFVRRGSASHDGLRSAVAFPLLADGKVLGVLELFSRMERSPVEEGVQMTTVVADEAADYLRRIEAQRNVRRSEVQKAAVLNAALDCVISMDAHGRVVAWNVAAENTFGFRAAEAIGKELASLIIPAGYRDSHRAGLSRYLRTGEQAYLGRRIEVSAVRRDGSEFPAELTITEIPGESPPLFTGFVRDITERKQAEAELRTNEERFRKTFSHAAVGIAEVALDGRWLRLNQRYCDLLGYSHDELTSLRFPNVTHPDDVAGDEEELRKLREGEVDSFSREKRYVRKDGAVVWVNLTASLVRRDGKPDYFIKVVEDIGDRKRMEETRERFIGILGHDLRNPLGTISLTANTLLRREDIPDHRRKAIRRIASSSDRMMRLIEELLDFTRGRMGGGIPISTTPMDLVDVCRDVLDELESGTPGLQIDFRSTGDTSGDWDPQRMAQVVSNLAGNAVRHRLPMSKVHVTLDGTAAEVVLVVNNAATCVVADPARLFDPFHRADSSGSEKESPGLGLGLYITSEIVRAHGGRVEASCTEVEGFTVTVRLPRHPPRAG